MTRELASVVPASPIGLARVSVRGTTDRALRQRMRETACVLVSPLTGLREVTLRVRPQATSPGWECSVWAVGRTGPILMNAQGDDPMMCVRRAVELVHAHGASRPAR